MGTFRFLEHTADEKFEVVAPTLEDAFATSVQAFYHVLLGPNVLVKRTLTRSISLQARTLRSLLYDFLNELVFYFDAQGELLQHVDSISITKQSHGFLLNATLAGDKTSDYDLLTEVKNMTYSEMEISQTSSDVTLQVVLDI